MSLKLVFLPVLAAGAVAAPGFSKCHRWEAGARYPWQSDTIMRDDRFALIGLEVDRRGFPIVCRVGKNNYPDADSRVWLCKQYYERWRGPPAKVGGPARRQLQRLSLVPGVRHARADYKARAEWFRAHPNEQPACYPEPSRPDRMDL